MKKSRFAVSTAGLVGLLFAVGVGAGEPPEKTYQKAYLTLKRAQSLNRRGETEAARGRLEECIALFRRLRAEEPGWRSAQVKTRLAEAEKSLGELSATAPPPSGEKGGAAPSITFASLETITSPEALPPAEARKATPRPSPPPPPAVPAGEGRPAEGKPESVEAPPKTEEAILFDRAMDLAAQASISSGKGQPQEADRLYGQAITAFEQVKELNPRNSLAHFFSGICYRKRKKWKMALDAYEKALDLDPAYAEAHFNIAGIYFKLGDLQKASEHWDRAAELGEFDPEFKEDAIRNSEIARYQLERRKEMGWE